MKKGSILSRLFGDSFEKVASAISDEEFVQAEQEAAVLAAVSSDVSASSAVVPAVVTPAVASSAVSAASAEDDVESSTETPAEDGVTEEPRVEINVIIQQAVQAAVNAVRSELNPQLASLQAENAALRARETSPMAAAVPAADTNPHQGVVSQKSEKVNSLDERMKSLAEQFPKSMAWYKSA